MAVISTEVNLVGLRYRPTDRKCDFFFFFFLADPGGGLLRRPGRRFAEKIWSVPDFFRVNEKFKGETRRSCKLARKRRKCSNISTCRLFLGAQLLILSASRFLTPHSPLFVPAPFLFSDHLHGMTFPFLSDRDPLWTLLFPKL